MKIGTDESYLRIERSSAADPYSSFLMQGYHMDSHSSFTGSCDAVVFDSGDEVQRALAAFERLEIHSLEIPGSGGCRLPSPVIATETSKCDTASDTGNEGLTRGSTALSKWTGSSAKGLSWN
jgi:hypothetical protein